MATEAKYKVFNGSTWVEYTFQPSSHTHSTVTVTETNPTTVAIYYPLYSTGKSSDQTVRASKDFYIYDGPTYSYLNVGSSDTLGALTMHQTNGCYINVVPASLTANRTITMPNEDGTIATKTYVDDKVRQSGSIPFQWECYDRRTLSKNSHYDITNLMEEYSEIMIVVRLVTNGTTSMGIEGQQGTDISLSLTGTSYTKILISKTDEDYFTMEMISSINNLSKFSWCAEYTSERSFYIFNSSSSASSVEMNCVIHVR